MSFYLSQVLAHFLLPAVIFSLLWSYAVSPFYKQRFWWFVLPAILGSAGYATLPFSQVYLLLIGSTYLAICGLLMVYGFFIRHPHHWLLFLQGTVIGLTSFMWTKEAQLDMVTATSVINTDLILNLAALTFGFIMVICTHFIMALLFTYCSRTLKQILLIGLVILAVIPLSGEVLLAAMRLDVIELQSGLLSYVSKVTNFFGIYVYAVLVLSLVPVAVMGRKNVNPLKVQIISEANTIERRKLQAQLNQYQRQRRGFIINTTALLCALLYWNLVASRPPRRSPAKPVVLDPDGIVRIPVTKDLLSGDLYCFEWVASDGKVVRFFIIDRYPGEGKLGVVFDACLLCGEAGYYLEGDKLICIACGVELYIPSVGYPGGCNPIPIKPWSLNNNSIEIPRHSLEAGLQYFSDVMELTVTDPVNGQALSNLDTPYSYAFGGKTYFFSTQSSYDAFRDNPWQYVDQSAALGDHE